MRIGAVLGDLLDFALNRQIAIGVFWVLDRQRDLFVAPHVFVLEPAFCRIDPEMRAVVAEPHRCHLRAAVRHQGGEMSESNFG